MKENRLAQYVRGLREVDVETARKALDDIADYRDQAARDLSLDSMDAHELVTQYRPPPLVWKHDAETNVLFYSPEGHDGYPYEVDLDRVKSVEDELSWIRHIAGKTWAKSPCVLPDLVKALREFSGNKTRG